MSRYATRKRVLSQPSPQTSITRKKETVSTVTLRNKSINGTALKIKSKGRKVNTKIPIKETRRPLKKQATNASKADENNTQGRKLRVRHKALLTKNVTSPGTSKSEEESKVKAKNTKKKINKNVPSLRQMSLKESFINQSVSKKLKLQKTNNNSKLVARNVSPKKTDTAALTRRSRRTKIPVYKSVPLEDLEKRTSEIYEFKFDANDSKERLPKKKKRKPTKKLKTNRKNIPPSKRTVREKPIDEEKPAATKPVQNEKDTIKVVSDKPTIKNTSKKELENLRKQDNLHTEKLVEPKLPENMPLPEDDTHENKEASDIVTKPTIMSIENVSNARIRVINTASVSNSGNPQSHRHTNEFNNSTLAVQNKNMLSHSLLQKSVSPIVKSYHNFDVSSPWRAPPLFTFSQVKNVFQSTPFNNKYDVASGKYVHMGRKESKDLSNKVKVRNGMKRNDENVSMENTIISNTPKTKILTAVRRFGTEITNREHSAQFSSPVAEMSEKILSDTENTLPNMHIEEASNINRYNVSKFDNKEDKENIAGFQSPRKILRKGMKKLKSRSPQKATISIQSENVENIETKENLDPVPGPSGLQHRQLLNEQRVLRQSNLNNFLNIIEMPKSTTIRTPHGIFGDGNLAPISRTLVKKPEESNTEIKNAFGFSDDDSIENKPPIEGQATPSEKNRQIVKTSTLVRQNIKRFAPARILLGEINNVQITKSKNVQSKVRNQNIKVNKENKIDKSPVKYKKTCEIDVTSFSDTFDILSETGNTSLDVPSCPLFVELEPSHFTKPPRHSYKRKRNQRFNFLEDSGSNEEDSYEPEVKRNKVGRVKKEDEKRLKEWIQNVNRTFDEIDHHDLLIE